MMVFEKKHFNVIDFQKKIYDFYLKNKRDFAWRQDISPYRVFVSEVMLQQTQTSRVISKFEQWTDRFPDFAAVAYASTHDILATWQGLGYNRRGLNLQKAARMIVEQFDGQLPMTVHELESLPGIGPNTAGSILAFAYNLPVTFIETNIRTVFLHEFFAEAQSVHDKEILSLVAQTVDHVSPRDWYYGLMDYGVYLKKELKANNKTSKHYTRQSKFIGSRREIRGAIVRILTQTKQLSHDDLICLVKQEIPQSEHDVDLILRQLTGEGLICEQNGIYGC